MQGRSHPQLARAQLLTGKALTTAEEEKGRRREDKENNRPMQKSRRGDKENGATFLFW